MFGISKILDILDIIETNSNSIQKNSNTIIGLAQAIVNLSERVEKLERGQQDRP